MKKNCTNVLCYPDQGKEGWCSRCRIAGKQCGGCDGVCQPKVKMTCLSLDCPERTGGECNAFKAELECCNDCKKDFGVTYEYGKLPPDGKLWCSDCQCHKLEVKELKKGESWRKGYQTGCDVTKKNLIKKLHKVAMYHFPFNVKGVTVKTIPCYSVEDVLEILK